MLSNKNIFLAFLPLLRLIQEKKPNTIILHLVTSLPLFINFIYNLKTNIILRISGFPRLNYFRNFLENNASKVNTITTPTVATKNKLSDILKRNDIILLKDPIIYLKILS